MTKFSILIELYACVCRFSVMYCSAPPSAVISPLTSSFSAGGSYSGSVDLFDQGKKEKLRKKMKLTHF